MSWVDLIIVIVVGLAGFFGYTEGAVRQVLRFAGFALGYYVATLVAPSFSSAITSSGWRPALALAIILVGGLIGGVVGSMLGALATGALHTLKLGVVNRIAGATLGLAGALVGCWLVAGLLASTAWGSIASGIQQSSILSAMDKIMPPVPTVESRIQSLFRKADFPDVFANLIAPSLPTPVNPTTLGPLVASLGQPSNVVKVLASGRCSSDSEGTAFYVASNEVLTNAHVVAGHTHVTVGGLFAQVVLFDPTNDLAVLRVPSGNSAAFSFLAGTPRARAAVTVVGFPLDATRTAAPGFVEGELHGTGRDIYNNTVDTKTVLALEVNINPGSSGSPVLEGSKVAGVIESKVISERSTAYAIPDSVIERDLTKTPTSGTVSTQRCLP